MNNISQQVYNRLWEQAQISVQYHSGIRVRNQVRNQIWNQVETPLQNKIYDQVKEDIL